MRDGIGAAEALTEEARVSHRMGQTTLTEGQREAVRTILLSHDRIVAVQGVAGSGKTTMLREVLDLIGERKAILLAPSAAAARVLADETGARVRTVQWFLTRYGDLGNAGKMANARREHEGSVLVLDESSMTSTAQMQLLMRISERLRVARLVLVGDRGQLRAVGAGEPFRALQDAGIPRAEMDEILRQRDPGLKRAVEALQQGRAAEAVRGFGEVREVPHEELGAEAERSSTIPEALSEAFREAARLPAVRAAIGQQTAWLARSPAPERWMAWTGDEPLVAGDRIAWRASGMEYHAAVAFPGDTGGMRANDTLLLRIAGPADGTALDDAGRIVEIGVHALWEGSCVRAAWSDEGLRQLEAARQYSVPSAACRLACSEPVEGDRIAWTEAAGRTGEVRTIEAVVTTRTETADGHEIGLRTIRASGPGAPDPGGSIRRAAEEVTARGCFRAPWSDEARRERILDPPKEEVREQTLTLRRGRSHGGGIGM